MTVNMLLRNYMENTGHEKNKIESDSQSTSLCTTKIVSIDWNQLHDVEYFTQGGSSNIHTAFYNGKNVIVKTINPEIENEDAYANDIENELNLLSRLNHPNIIKIYGDYYIKQSVLDLNSLKIKSSIVEANGNFLIDILTDKIFGELQYSSNILAQVWH